VDYELARQGHGARAGEVGSEVYQSVRGGRDAGHRGERSRLSAHRRWSRRRPRRSRWWWAAASGARPCGSGAGRVSA